MIEQLLNAARPIKKFEVKIGENMVTLGARRPGAIEAQKIFDAWNKAYEDSRIRLADKGDKTDFSVLERSLKQQPNERLAKYIARADRLEMLGEAQMLCDDKPADDPMVQAKCDELVIAREKELAESEPRESLLQMAMERRAHIHAMIEAQIAQVRTSVVQTVVHPDTGEKAFADETELGLLPENVIDEIYDKANEALTEPKDDPLK